MSKVIIASLIINLVCFVALILAVFLPGYPLFIALIPCYVIGIVLGILTIGKQGIPLFHKALALAGPFISPLIAIGCIQLLKAMGILGDGPEA
ncbi:MAG: hypothetical protein CMF59_17795 [Leptospiraceae bacterium]|nr:hypothetical protein [Leptospiraceae bacterium]